MRIWIKVTTLITGLLVKGTLKGNEIITKIEKYKSDIKAAFRS